LHGHNGFAAQFEEPEAEEEGPGFAKEEELMELMSEGGRKR
jgi:hypothetical protein